MRARERVFSGEQNSPPNSGAFWLELNMQISDSCGSGKMHIPFPSFQVYTFNSHTQKRAFKKFPRDRRKIGFCEMKESLENFEIQNIFVDFDGEKLFCLLFLR